MIDAGRAITFDVQGTTGEYIPRSVSSVRAIVIDQLAPYFDVEDVAFQTSSVLSDPFHSLSNWPYRATVRALPLADYGDVRDVDSIVAHAFYEAAGNLPTVTASGYETPQGPSDQRAGLSFGLGALLLVVGLVALATIKVAD